MIVNVFDVVLVVVVGISYWVVYYEVFEVGFFMGCEIFVFFVDEFG